MIHEIDTGFSDVTTLIVDDDDNDPFWFAAVVVFGLILPLTDGAFITMFNLNNFLVNF